MKRVLALGLVALTIGAAPAPATAKTPCQEDQRCWNWRTMGDHQRGIVTLHGRKLVVSVKRFDRLNRAFRIDWELSRKLRGDGYRFDVQDY